MTQRRTALVAGVSGAVGRHIAEQLSAAGDWDVIGLARRPPPASHMRLIGVDLAELADCEHKLSNLADVTHVFYAARYDHPEGAPEPVEVNVRMLSNLITTLESAARLEHVHVVHGTKYYGYRVGAVSLPLREDSPRGLQSNYYFQQEDFLRAHSAGKGWSYTTSRPHAVCDSGTDNPRSIGLVIAVYAAVQRELGAALDFPGTEVGFRLHTQFTDLALLARGAIWMATEPRCANQAFNMVNGDTPGWETLWPQFAVSFGMRCGVPGKIKLAQYMSDKGEVWRTIVKRYRLRETELETLASWPYGDFQFAREHEAYSTMQKARSFGFLDAVSSAAMFEKQFASYRRQNVIPQ